MEGECDRISQTDLPKSAVPAWASSNITAGSDTTAILLRAIFYHLLRNPSTLGKLQAEIDGNLGTAPNSTNSSPQDDVVSWRRSRDGLPYLDACIKEATRMQPSFGLPYERVVPGVEGGGPITVCGKLLPPGTVVGMSAWAVGRDLGLYGHDADVWRPERWLGVGEARRHEMENGLLAVSFASLMPGGLLRFMALIDTISPRSNFVAQC